MATVYRGRHSTLDRPVAIKVLHPHLSSSAHNRKRFKREVDTIKLLRHQNILEIFDYSGDDVYDCYIVTEFVDGETLTSLLMRRGRFPSEIACLIALSLCRALGYAHAQGILHRDVKGDNIMVRTDGTVKLMDFGIARFLDDAKVTMTGALVGSPAFMSPEQAKEDPLDQRSDLFALGTVLFYLVSGHLPFTGSNPSLILKNVIEGNRPHVAELAPTMSATFADIIERLMATNPNDRFTTASDVERQLLQCLTESHLLSVAAQAFVHPPSEAPSTSPTSLEQLLSHDSPEWGLVSPEWALVQWLLDPDAYEARLDQHLRRVLIEEGRSLLAAGDHLTALRLLNRLLSMDENNAEVLSLVQGLHGEPVVAPRRPKLLAGMALVAIGLGVIALFIASLWAPPKEPDHDAIVDRTEPIQVNPQPAPAGELLGIEPVPVPISPPAPPNNALQPRPKIEHIPLPVPEPPVPEIVPEPAEPQIAYVRLNPGDYVAKVYQGDVEIGDTRSELRVAAGTNTLVLKSPLMYEQTIEVTVASGERRVVPVTLRPKPAQLSFSERYAGSCEVGVDGLTVGTLETLQWSWTIQRPDQPHSVVLSCPGGSTHSERWSTISAPKIQFPGP